MQYMLLIYRSEDLIREQSPEQFGAIMDEFAAFDELLEGRGAVRSTEALHPTSTATTVRVRDGKTLTTDGPFAETKEQLGGYYVIEAKDLDEAIDLAAKLPIARLGSIEIRPVRTFE